ncbi:MAG: helix-turn-helix domain-containing protein [Eubacterium ramulus]
MSDNIKDVIAKNLLFYRKKNKITQKKLAEKLGVKHNAISSWKNGVNSIDIDTLFRVCQNIRNYSK